MWNWLKGFWGGIFGSRGPEVAIKLITSRIFKESKDIPGLAGKVRALNAAINKSLSASALTPILSYDSYMTNQLAALDLTVEESLLMGILVDGMKQELMKTPAVLIGQATADSERMKTLRRIIGWVDEVADVYARR